MFVFDVKNKQKGSTVIKIDITFFIQFVNFVVSLGIINYLIIKPVRENLAKRRSLVNADKDSAEALTSSADEKFKSYEERLQKVRSQVADAFVLAKEESEATTLEVLEKANLQAHAVRSEASALREEQSKQAKSSLDERVPQFVETALAKILN